jgi:hypothetical protein
MTKYQSDKSRYAEELAEEEARIADAEAAGEEPDYTRKFRLEDYVSVYDEVIANL